MYSREFANEFLFFSQCGPVSLTFGPQPLAKQFLQWHVGIEHIQNNRLLRCAWLYMSHRDNRLYRREDNAAAGAHDNINAHSHAHANSAKREKAKLLAPLTLLSRVAVAYA